MNDASLRLRIARWIAGQALAAPQSASQQKSTLNTAQAKVDDSSGWGSLSNRPHDYDRAKIVELYQDALDAWRKNPIAWRIVAITTDYVVGERYRISSSNRYLNKYLRRFWNHPKNQVNLRLEAMCEELARAGDLFVVLFRNEQDGMSYIRFVTKDRIAEIETAENDWENEIAYVEISRDGERRRWLSPSHPDSAQEQAVMLHYAVNKPVGALMGESDLTSMIPWLMRYSRMLEDRVRLHWSVRAFLWIVTVPLNRVLEKREQYRNPPESGSIVVKDEAEKWDVVSPMLRGADASHDLKAVRGMIDAGSGYPPHWRGEAGQANLATATAMQSPTEKHLTRRQNYFSFLLQDIVYQAYQRALEIGRVRKLGTNDYATLFTLDLPDISRSDNEALARSARDLANAFGEVCQQMPGRSRTLNKILLRLVLKFAGEPQSERVLEDILAEARDGQ